MTTEPPTSDVQPSAPTLDPIARVVGIRRRQLNWSVVRLAHESGVVRSKLCNWLNGKRTVTAVTAGKVMAAMDLVIGVKKKK